MNRVKFSKYISLISLLIMEGDNLLCKISTDDEYNIEVTVERLHAYSLGYWARTCLCLTSKTGQLDVNRNKGFWKLLDVNNHRANLHKKRNALFTKEQTYKQLGKRLGHWKFKFNCLKLGDITTSIVQEAQMLTRSSNDPCWFFSLLWVLANWCDKKVYSILQERMGLRMEKV